MLCRAGCGLEAHPLIRCEVALRLAVVNAPKVANAVVNAAPAPMVVNASRKKDRHKKVRSDYFREYMKLWRALKSGRAELIR